MALRVLYRSYGGENRKNRPEYYSKRLALSSLLRAAEKADPHLVFLNDGPIPADRLRLMTGAGDVESMSGLGMRGSFWTGLRYAAGRKDWHDDDLVWFAEDDYLYLPEALHALQRAAEVIPDADYFGLTGDEWSNPERPAGWKALPPWSVDGHEWVRIYSTTSTFGVRLGALREDLRIFRFCMIPHAHQYRDHDMHLVHQGFEPYRYGDLARAAIGLSGTTARDRVREAALAPFLLATNLRAHRRPERRRLLLASRPNFAAHLEIDMLPAGVDWAAVAEDVRQWSRATGHEQPAA